MSVIRARARRRQNRRRGAIGAMTAMTVLGVALIIQPLGTGPRRQGGTTASDPQLSANPPRKDTSSSANLDSGATRQALPMPAAPASKGPVDVELETSSATVLPGAPLRLKIKVCNRGSQEVEVSFGTSQRYDFEVMSDKTSAIVWRWSDGMLFAQVIGKERFAPGCLQLGETSWDGSDSEGRPVEPGTYKARAILTSAPRVRSSPRDVCVISCG